MRILEHCLNSMWTALGAQVNKHFLNKVISEHFIVPNKKHHCH